MTHSLTSAELDALTQAIADKADAASTAGKWDEYHTWQAAITLIESARRESNQRDLPMPISKSAALSAHPSILKEKGWTYRAAAERLGVDFGHLRRVLHGERQSNRLLKAVHALPVRKPVTHLLPL